ncbi:acyl carrier protein [Geofilum rhodophaeum]|uniref:acyl carrier protein n=1 Tax=Geofilum rhodophaeum TaxID=1965019 RepID=UPI000B52348A|nr:acyl carrier protein [Geofilum rhodophaeum]
MEKQFLNAFKEALEIEDRDVALDDVFREFDEWSSLGQLSLIAMLDEEYEVVIEHAAFERLLTVGDVLKEVQKRLAS